MKSAFLVGLVIGLVLPGCDAIGRQRPAMGDMTSLIVVTTDSLWAEIGDEVERALEPRIFAVRDEPTFEVTRVSPANPDWLELQRFRQILAFGTADDFWTAEALAGGTEAQAPSIVERRDVWARSQLVTVVLLPAESRVEAARSLAPRLADLLDTRFRQYARGRMFLSDSNTALRDSLAKLAGFAITLPNIYRPAQAQDRVWAFHNRNEVGGDLFRTVIVAWRPGTVAAAGVEPVLAWRDSVLPLVYDVPQTTVRDRVETRPLEGQAAGSIEVHGIWTGTDAAFPTGGLFVDRVVLCPDQDRTYFLEAWMYGPGRRKYEYLLQFQMILDSFRCGVSAA